MLDMKAASWLVRSCATNGWETANCQTTAARLQDRGPDLDRGGSFAWLGRNRRLGKDYEYAVQMSEIVIDIAAIRIMLNRLAPA